MVSKIEKQLCSPNRHKEISCTDSIIPKHFRDVFRPVNAYKCDSLGLGCGFEGNSDCHNSFYSPDSKAFNLFQAIIKHAVLMGIRSANALHIKNGIDNNSFGRYQTARRLDSYMTYRSIPGYNDELFLAQGGVQSTLDKYSKEIERPIKCLDLGCGRGFAVQDLNKLDCVQDVMGVSLPLSNVIFRNRKKILFADILCLSPASENAKFDAVFSVYGGIHYNPLNEISNFNVNHQIYGILQGLKFLKEGGLLFINNGLYSTEGKGSIDAFLKEYLRFYLPAQKYAKDQSVQPNVYQFIKKPDFHEIKNILKIHEKYLLGQDYDPENWC